MGHNGSVALRPWEAAPVAGSACKIRQCQQAGDWWTGLSSVPSRKTLIEDPSPDLKQPMPVGFTCEVAPNPPHLVLVMHIPL